MQVESFQEILSDSFFTSGMPAEKLKIVNSILSALESGDDYQTNTSIFEDKFDVVIDQKLNELFRKTRFQNKIIDISEINNKRTVIVPENEDISIEGTSTVLSAVNFCINSRIKKDKKILVLLSAKDEGPWIIEWISHYLALGVQSFLIYSNDNMDGMDDIIELLAGHIDITFVKNVVPASVSPQKRAFSHALQFSRVLHASEWVAAFDADEFCVTTDPKQQLNNTIADISASFSVDNIAINWAWFSGVRQFEWNDGYSFDRFRQYHINPMKKCIFRPQRCTSLHQIHFPTLLNAARSIDSTGSDISDLSVDKVYSTEPRLLVNHYFSRSFEEFALKKLRGRGAVGAGDEQRKFDNFTWGLSRNVEAYQYPDVLRAKFTSFFAYIENIPGIKEAQEICIRSARQRLHDSQANIDLRKIYDSLIEKIGDYR